MEFGTGLETKRRFIMTALVITLMIVGLLLLGAELIIIPGFGIAGILGIAALVASCWVSFVYIGTTAGVIVILVNIILVVATTILMLRSRTWKKLSLKTNIDSKVDVAPEEKGIAVGNRGIALTRLAPAGKVQIGENAIEAFTRDSLVEPGREVEVCEIAGNKIIVKEI